MEIKLDLPATRPLTLPTNQVEAYEATGLDPGLFKEIDQTANEEFEDERYGDLPYAPKSDETPTDEAARAAIASVSR